MGYDNLIRAHLRLMSSLTLRLPFSSQISACLLGVMLVLFADMALAQSPEDALKSISPDDQAWVNQSCPKSLGPSLWSSCVNREVRALKGRLPDLSKLSEADRKWVFRTCPSSLGPSLTISCLSREVSALSSGTPKLEKLSPDKLAWVRQTCPQSLGPSLYKSCVEREARALTAGSQPLVGNPNPSMSQATPRVAPPLRSSRRANSYLVEVAHNDEFFIINGEKYEAQTYCFNTEKGDEVIFLEGSAFGACVSATVLNLRTREKCNLWCE